MFLKELKNRNKTKENNNFFLQLCCPHAISPMAHSGCLSRKSQLRQSRATKPIAHAVFNFLKQCFHNPPNSDMDNGIFNVHTDVNACDCTRGCTDTIRESALKVDSRKKKRKKPLPHRRIDSTSTTCRCDALPTELHPNPATAIPYG